MAASIKLKADDLTDPTARPERIRPTSSRQPCYFDWMVTDADLAATAALIEQRFGLHALWLFGSHASGTARADSDVDLGVLFDKKPSVAELFDLRSNLAALLGVDVDVVDLERASPILAMQVARTGHLLVDRDQAHRIRFLAALPGRYEDVLRVRRPAELALRARMHAGS